MVRKRQAERRKYHFIYKTTCLVNGKFYYGMYSTDDLQDGYIGSGTYLAKSIRKHGRENFSIEILEFCVDRKSLKIREAELITEDMLQDKMCMNLKLGGEGGFTLSAEQYSARNGKCGKLSAEKHKAKLSEKFTLMNKSMNAEKNSRLNAARNKKRIGSHQTESTKSKISEAVSGSNNAMHGKVWIYSLEEQISKRIDKSDVESHLSQGWFLGRKMRFTKTQSDVIMFSVNQDLNDSTFHRLHYKEVS